MDIDELIKQAQLKYPKGTKFISLKSGNHWTSTGEVRIMTKDPVHLAMYIKEDYEFTSSSVYKNEKWAKLGTEQYQIF